MFNLFTKFFYFFYQKLCFCSKTQQYQGFGPRQKNPILNPILSKFTKSMSHPQILTSYPQKFKFLNKKDRFTNIHTKHANECSCVSRKDENDENYRF